MNRIFDPEQPIDLAVEPAPPPPAPALAEDPPAQEAPSPGTAPDAPQAATAEAFQATSASDRSLRFTRWQRFRTRAVHPAAPRAAVSIRLPRPDERLLLTMTLCGVCLASLVGSLLYFRHWTRLQQNLAQERNLLLLERLRALGPANPSPVPGPEPAAPTLPAPAGQSASGSDGLPPPPPQEPWIEQLSSLPSPTATPPRVLSVPVSPRLASAAPSPSPQAAVTPSPPRATPPLPQLVGVVAGAGRAPAAIFLVSGSSMSVASGELIGSTGWRLRSAEGETALIERGAELRQVSIASGNGL